MNHRFIVSRAVAVLQKITYLTDVTIMKPNEVNKMKTFLAMLTLITATLTGYGQINTEALKDDLVPTADQILKKYVPMHNGTYLYKFYAMEPEEVNSLLGDYKNEIHAEIEKSENAADSALAKKDLDYRIRTIQMWYSGNYGTDSVGMENMFKVMQKHVADSNFVTLVTEAQKKAYLKRLKPEQMEVLRNQVFGDPDLGDALLYQRSAAYRTWLEQYLNYTLSAKYASEFVKGGAEARFFYKLKTVQNEFPEGSIKDLLLYQETGNILSMTKDSTKKNEVYQDFLANSKNEKYKKSIEQLYLNDQMMSGGGLSPDFNFPDVNGNMVSLASLRGKYVYIDVWATWCGPCKAEIPFLQKVEHDYADKNIHFVSLSVDRMKDQGAWKSYVRDNELGGIQLMADQDFKSDFVKKYNINAIPRFILIDPKGHIVSGNADRPSNPKLREQLDTLLN